MRTRTSGMKRETPPLVVDGTIVPGGPSSNKKQKTGDPDAKGAKGGTGEGPEFFTLLVSDDIITKVPMPTLSMVDFCAKYELDGELGDILSENEYERASDLLFTKEKLAFKLAHTAELKWALKHMLLSLAIPEEAPKKRRHRPDIAGGRGGPGGFGAIVGGTGGLGKAPVIGMNRVHLFRSIRGGIGGAGGPSNRNSGLTRKNEATMHSEQAEIEDTDREELPNVFGGDGQRGGYHYQKGGDGGDGEGPVIPIEGVGNFGKIEGGLGGAGGDSDKVGGTGGIGHAPKLPELLVPIDVETRLHVQNVKLTNSEKLRQSKFEISDRLNKLLRDDGFLTVGGLFEICDTDLDREPFKPGHKAALTRALTEFLQEMKRVEVRISQTSYLVSGVIEISF